MSDPVVPVVRRTDYWIGLEQNNGNTWAHAIVHRWTPRTARAFRRDADALFALHGGPMLATTHAPHGGDFRKHRKFMLTIGFTEHRTVTVDGVAHVVYIRRE